MPPKIAVISANLDNFEKRIWFKQKNMPQAKLVMFTDETFPKRSCAMTPRLQAKIPKCFGWQMVPGYDIYIWMDAIFGLRQGGIEFMVEKLGDKDMAFFKHPHKSTVQKEWHIILRDEPYMNLRYRNELDGGWDKTGSLLAGGIFAYRNNKVVQNMLKEWWYNISRFHIDDQLSLPTVLNESGCSYNVIDEHIYNTSYFVPLRRR